MMSRSSTSPTSSSLSPRTPWSSCRAKYPCSEASAAPARPRSRRQARPSGRSRDLVQGGPGGPAPIHPRCPARHHRRRRGGGCPPGGGVAAVEATRPPSVPASHHPGRHGLGLRGALGSGAEMAVHAYTNGFAPGAERLTALGVPFRTFKVSGTSRGRGVPDGPREGRRPHGRWAATGRSGSSSTRAGSGWPARSWQA